MHHPKSRSQNLADDSKEKTEESVLGSVLVKTLIAAGGFTQETGETALESGDLDSIAFGRPFIANPDLVERMKNGWSLATADRSTWYGNSGERGDTDFPRYESLSEQ